tara:strand:- start:169 stop:1389 length:1221 start_codon:yes stop_codon:yes gene_type:complete
MDRATKTSGINVGFVMFVATVVVIIALFWVGSGNGIFQEQAQYHFMCPSTSRLKDGSRVYLSGVPVGKVEEIDFVDDLSINSVKVTVSVAERVSRRIREDSSVSLESDGLLGDVSVHITMGTSESLELSVNNQIRYLQSSPLEGFVGAEFTGTAGDVLRELVVVLKAIESGKGTVGKLLREPELYDNLNAFLKSLATLSVKLEQVATDLGTFTDSVTQEKGVLGKLLFSEEYERDLGRAIASTAEIAVRLEGALSASADKSSVVTRLFFDERLGERLDNVLVKLEAGSDSLSLVLGMLERGEGSVGQLLHDPSIAASIKDLFLGIQEVGYMRNIIQNAELQGREAKAGDDRASAMARLEASRARMLARLNAPREEGEPKKDEEGSGKEEPAPAKGTDARREGAVPE